MAKKYLVLRALLFAVLFFAPLCAWSADGSSYVYDAYTYDYWLDPVESPAPFLLERTISSSNLVGANFRSVTDVCATSDGRIFVVDSVASRIYVFNCEGQLLRTLRAIQTEQGKMALDKKGRQVVLNNPEGVFVHEQERELYIADTGAERIDVLNLDDYTIKNTILRPEGMSGVTEFKPSKIAVDKANRIFTVVQSSYEGIVEMDYSGNFIGYYGVNKPQVNLVQYFWKSIASDKQKTKMKKNYAPSFSNIAVDGEGFVMAVTADTSSKERIFRLNSKGENVIRAERPVVLRGNLDIASLPGAPHSTFVDLAVTGYGTYAVLDSKRGQIFLYNYDGELMSTFGSLGNIKGQLKNPTAIAWLGNKLLVSDTTIKCVYVFAPTDFGRAILDASDFYYNGKWDKALERFRDASMLDSNYEIAYTGIGKNYLMKGDYDKAMYYFKVGNNREFYSKAFYGSRGQWLKNHFIPISILLVVLIFLLFYSEYRYAKKGSKTKGASK